MTGVGLMVRAVLQLAWLPATYHALFEGAPGENLLVVATATNMLKNVLKESSLARLAVMSYSPLLSFTANCPQAAEISLPRLDLMKTV